MSGQGKEKAIPTNDNGMDASQDDLDGPSWDAENTKIFIEVCIDNVKNGEKKGPYTIFGWPDVARDFQTRTGLNYHRLVLSDKWEELKKEWELWNKLVSKEKGLKKGHESDMVKAKKDLLKAKLQENSNYSKFHLFGLVNKDELDIMFRDTFGIGAYAISASCIDDLTIHQSRKRSRSVKPSKPRKKKSTVMDAQIDDALEQLISIIDLYCAKESNRLAEKSKRLAEKAERKAPTNDNIPRVMACLNETQGITKELYFFAMDSFKDPDNRALFIATKPECRLGYLQKKYLESKGES